MGKQENALTKREKAELMKTEGTEEENRKFLTHAFLPYAGRGPVSLLDPVAIGERVSAYWDSCSQSNIMPNPPGMAAWLGVSQDQFKEWLAGMGSIENRTLASRTYQMLHQTLIDRSLSGKVSPQLVMFYAQNWFGYQNKNAVELQQAAPAPPNLDKLAAEAAALPDGAVIDADFVEIESGGKMQKGKKKKK